MSTAQGATSQTGAASCPNLLNSTGCNGARKDVPEEAWVAEQLQAEGFAILTAEQIREEILASTGGVTDIHVVGSRTNQPFYDFAYNRLMSGQESQAEVAQRIGSYMGEREHVPDGRTFRQSYEDEHSRLMKAAANGSTEMPRSASVAPQRRSSPHSTRIQTRGCSPTSSGQAALPSTISMPSM